MGSNFVDHFGKAGNNYAKFRPEYPDALFQEIFDFAGDGRRDLAIDLGTGTGQATLPLTKHYKKVIGFEPSAGQIVNAEVKAENLEFRQSPAEKVDLPSESVDLITTAQAVHWFDLPVFYDECYRLLRKDGTLAIWGYGTLKIDDEQADAIFQDFYANVLGDQYWPSNRKMVENHYRDINPSPPFPATVRKSLSMHKDFDMNGLFGYFSTFSGVKEYREKAKADPLPPLRQKLAATSLAHRTFRLTFPIFLLMARK